MEKKSHDDDHDQLPSDEVTRNKISKHLSDIDDTISEEDLKNINTVVTGTENEISKPKEKTGKKKRDDSGEEPEEPEKEAPTPWEILGE